jgi:hypothetical protein
MLIGAIVGFLQQSGAAKYNRVWGCSFWWISTYTSDANQYIMCFINFIIGANIVSKTLLMGATNWINILLYIG